MTEQSQIPLVGPPKRRGWREIVWFRPLTSFTHATLVVTRRGRLTSVVPANSPRVLSDYLAWPYDFREVDTRERLLTFDQRLASFDSGYEFCVSLRLVYQVTRADRVALEFEDVQAELAHAVVQSLRASGRSFGVEQDKTFEEHLQETLIHGDALVQRAQSLGLALRRADVTITLDEQTQAHAEALRSAMRERPLHFQVAVESLEPDRSFDVHVGGAYRLTERRAQEDPGEAIESAIHMAVARTLRRVGITFAPSDYPNAAKAMAETLRRDALLQSELSIVQAQLLRPTVQIQPDRSMIHVPRPNPLGAPDTRPDPMLRRLRHGLPRTGRPPALVDMQEHEQPPETAPAAPRALPPPQPVAGAASPTLPLEELPAASDAIEGAYTFWPHSDSLPAVRALPAQNQPDDEQDAGAPWADLIKAANRAPQDIPWMDTPPPVSSSEPADALPWESAVMDEPAVSAVEAEPALLTEPVEPLPWESAAAEASQPPAASEQAPHWLETPPVPLSQPVEPLPWESAAMEGIDQPPAENGPALVTEPAESEQAPHWLETPAPVLLSQPVEPLPWDGAAIAEASQPPAESEQVPHWLETPPVPLSQPAFANTDLAGDLGFSLDWSEPESAATASATPDDLGFSLDWSELLAGQADSVATPVADASGDDRIITAHWEDQVDTPLEPALSSDESVEYSSAGAVTINLERRPAFDPVQTQEFSNATNIDSLPAEVEQEQAQPASDQQAPPWYTPTLHLGDQLLFDASPEETYAAPAEMLGPAWAEVPAANYPLADPSVQEPNEPLDAGWTTEDELPAASAPLADAPLETSDQPRSEPLDTAWAEPPVVLSEPAPAASSEQPSAHDQAADEVPADLVARMISMIQSYGPAWFKMWSLELKERPERLPVVLGEVTADPLLLAQADDPRVQSALLLALAAYSAPAAFPARLPAPIPSPAIAGQSDDADEVPDWLSLRVKWNGHGGGA